MPLRRLASSGETGLILGSAGFSSSQPQIRVAFMLRSAARDDAVAGPTNRQKQNQGRRRVSIKYVSWKSFTSPRLVERADRLANRLRPAERLRPPPCDRRESKQRSFSVQANRR